MDDDSPKVADYFVSVGLNNLEKPEIDTETLDPITDVAVIFKSLGEEPPKGYECVDLTPSGLPADLNHGSIRTQSCFLCFKRGRDKPPLMDIGVLFEGKQKLMHGCDIVHKTPSKHIANVNNGSNMRIFITYRRASPQFSHSSLAVIEICVILANKGEKPPHAFNMIDKNLNQGLVGSEVYLCYRKSLARSNTLSYSAEIISRYPLVDGPDYLLPDSISLFCLPLGAVIECWPEKAQHPLPIFSTFALTCGKGEKIYGGGVTFFEEFDSTKLTDEVQELIDQQQQNHKDDRVVAQTNRCICVLSRYPFFQAFRKFLLSIYRLSLSAKQTIPIERYIAHFMHRIPFPTPQKPIVHVQLTHEVFEITQPNDGPLPVSGASFTDLLRCLGSERTLTLLCCILTEQKILVHSLRPALLTSVCEALTSLIFPFQWKCPYIPLCPLKLADVLFAPFPFIYGVDSRYFDQAQPPSDVTCVDLDTHMITQAVAKDIPFISGKLLPKKPAKCLKDKLDEIFPQLYPVNSDDISSAVDMAPLDDAADVATEKKKKTIELYIQEAFLRFHAQILQGYKQYLLPITSQPDLASRDLNTLFDLQGFMKSRPRGTERFYQMLVKTQLFSHFIETRSFTSSGHVNVLVFFDDCIDKCDTPARLLRGETKSSNATTVVVTPPDANGLPPDQVYTYTGFPVLNPDLFLLQNPIIQNLKATNVATPPRSPIIGRTPHERQLGTLSAKKQANSPTLWARCLLGHCFTIWFIHLPTYIKSHKKKKKILYKAFEIIQKINKLKAKLPDEVCYRILIQLAGQLNHPALAVKVLFEMKRVGVQINAVTWGDYHKAVLESKWEPDAGDKTHAQQLWCKVRLVFMAMFAFRKVIIKNQRLSKHVETDVLIDIGEGVKPIDYKDETTPSLPLETSSVGAASDAGYSSGLISTEDLSRSHPSAGSLSDLRQHRRNFSNTSELSISSVEEFVIKKTTFNNKIIPPNAIRRPSESSISSTMSEGTAVMNSTNSHIIVQHEPSLADSNASSLLNSSLDLFDNMGQLFQTQTRQPDVMLEAVICSCQVCTFCHKVIYDEEVMGGWSADDSNLNIICPFCQTKKVPTLEIKIKDYRGLKSKVCSTNSLSSSNCSASFSKALAEARGSVSTSNPLLNFAGSNTETQLIDIPLNNQIPPAASSSANNTPATTNQINDSNMNLLEDFLSPSASTSSTPVPPTQSNNVTTDTLIDVALSTSAPASGTGSPVNTPAVRTRPTMYKHRKSSSASSGGSFSMIFGTPGEKIVSSVPYLSPLVLRKELENLLQNHGDSMLQSSQIVEEKPIIYWNLLWYFCRLNLVSHLPQLLLQSYNKKSEEFANCTGEVRISSSWDLNRQTKDHIPLYMLWSLPNEQHDALAQQGYTKKSVLSTITHHIQQNDVVIPMKMLLDERCRKQEKNPEVHWSLYRELLFLSLTSCGADNIDIDAFDREYSVAYREIQREYSETLHPDDKMPSAKAVFCRETFEAPTLQPRRPRIF